MSIRSAFLCLMSIIITLSLVVITPIQTVHASTLTVNTLNDEADGSCLDGDCSLRDALFVSSPSGDVITFSVTGILPLTLGQLVIGNSITINGPGAGLLTISGESNSRVFLINTSTSVVTITGLTIANGRVTDEDGGGVLNQGTLTLDQVIIDNNKAVESTSMFVDGGGIYNTNILTITNSLLMNNVANFTGGAISDVGVSLNLFNVTINDNFVSGNGSGGIGGGIAAINSGSITLDSVRISSNAAKTAGGMYINNVTQFEMSNSLVFSNDASDHVGGIWFSGTTGNYSIRNSTISTNRQTTLSSGQAGGLWVDGLLSANLSHVTITNNTTVGTAGGAGAFITLGATLSLQNSIIAGNTSSNSDDDDCNGIMSSFDYNLIQDADGNCTITGTTTHNITGQDALLNPLGDNGGATKTHALQTSSPALNVIPNSTNGCGTTFTVDQRGLTRPQQGSCEMGAFEFIPTAILTVKSVAVNDGWILESRETSGKGGTMNNTATNFFLGDDLADRQYRAILHFDTSSIPDNAIVTSATLKIRKQGMSGENPFNILGNLNVSMRKPAFGVPTLTLTDFKSAAGQNNVSLFGIVPTANWYSAALNSIGKSYLNRTGSTQFRLFFTTDDNNDNGNDFMKFFSGNAGAANRPQLIIEYYLP